jgi:hypothetical protein
VSIRRHRARLPPTSERAHLEHILAKLSARSRTAAAVSALRLWLFVPRLLRGSLSGDDAAQ